MQSLPWDELGEDDAFFVPAIDLERTRNEGLRQSMRYKIPLVKTAYVIVHGRLGVLFYRGYLQQRLRTGFWRV
jgi:hypothetical protein